MRRPGCPECERLWEAYADATFEFVKAVNARKLAELRDARDEVVQLAERTSGAHQERLCTLERVKKHEAAHED